MLLGRLGVPFIVRASHIPENSSELRPAMLVKELALRKAKATAERVLVGRVRPATFVLGADTIVALGRKILGKPTDRHDAYAMLSSLSGSIHHVYTGVALIEVGTKRQWVRHAVSQVRMKKMPPAQISRLSKRHLDKAGAYAIQDRRDPYARVIKGTYENVVGLPLHVVSALLRQAGFKVSG